MTPSEEARASLDAAVDEALDSYATDMVLIWSRASDEAKTERDAMERELLKVRQENRVLLAKPRSHECVCAECERKNELLKREPLVQEVIRLSKLEYEASRSGGPIRDAVKFHGDVVRAARKLAEWKP